MQRTIAPLAEKKSQTLTVDVADALPRLVADPVRLKQVLINLLSNANKFTPEGGSITLSCRLADQDTMLFSVTDTGIGIKAEDQTIIFEEFRQSSDVSAGEIEGTGLGLAISKRLIEMHGGSIWIESEYGTGSTFSFLIPIGVPEKPEPEMFGETTERSKSKTAFVVDDDHQFSSILAHYLRQEGYAPIQHYTGADVIECVLELRPDIITLDILLPDQDGWEIIRNLRSNPQTKNIPILVISAIQEGELALSLGATDYLVKPVRRKDVRNLLRRLFPPEAEGQKVKVLIVDDDKDISILLKEMLAGDHYEMLTARDGQEGFNIAHREPPDIILLDLMMPGKSGFDMIKRLQAEDKTAKIPVIVLTAIDVTPEQRQFLEKTTVGIMRKTRLTPQSLLAELRRLEQGN